MDRHEYEINQLINPKKDIVKSNSKHRDKIETLILGRNGGVYYNPIEPPLPNNIITYEASTKLTETTSSKSSGLHTNKFGTTMVSHTFENGVGTIEFEDDVTTIGDYAFYGCIGLTSVTIPNSVTTISLQSFYNCSGLTSVTIPNSVTSIGNAVFANCSGLTSVTIGNGVTSIGDNAFEGCSRLTSVTIPDSVTSIGQAAFQRCSSLTSIVVDSGNIVYDSRDNCNAIIETSTNKLVVGCKNTIIPNTVTSIGQYAFYYCGGLTNVTIGNTVTSIGQYAFGGCSGLISATIGNGVISIGINAFGGCSGLTSVTIGSGVTSIGDNAFRACYNLTSITIPDSVTSIGYMAFSNCSGLTSITVEATTPPTLGSQSFDNTNNCPIYVPSASVEAYKAASGWSTYADRIQAIH